MVKDLFSEQAKQYSEFRPRYPLALYEFIFGNVGGFDVAWDAGTGNGQAASVLASRFRKVSATDISATQLENAVRMVNIDYHVGGETTLLPDHSVDLITVAQAIHWFDRKKFWQEVKRVSKPDGTVAVWGYGLLNITCEIDPFIREFYTKIVGPYWDPERRLIDERYASFDFPFEEIQSPTFTMDFEWTLAELEGYLTTWSAVRKYQQERGENPVQALMKLVEPLWRNEKSKVRFPLFVRLGRVGV